MLSSYVSAKAFGDENYALAITHLIFSAIAAYGIMLQRYNRNRIYKFFEKKFKIGLSLKSS